MNFIDFDNLQTLASMDSTAIQNPKTKIEYNDKYMLGECMFLPVSADNIFEMRVCPYPSSRPVIERIDDENRLYNKHLTYMTVTGWYNDASRPSKNIKLLIGEDGEGGTYAYENARIIIKDAAIMLRNDHPDFSPAFVINDFAFNPTASKYDAYNYLKNRVYPKTDIFALDGIIYPKSSIIAPILVNKYGTDTISLMINNHDIIKEFLLESDVIQTWVDRNQNKTHIMKINDGTIKSWRNSIDSAVTQMHDNIINDLYEGVLVCREQ